MINAYKEVGETPLQLLDRLRIERPELKDEKLSYAGRLDPMAEGEMLILVGEENNKYNEHFEYDKEYEATFLVGVSTDTGDVLGLIERQESGIRNQELELKKQIRELKKIKEQIYPWFSGRKVKGKKLFDYFKEGNLDIERPKLDVEIKECELLSIYQSPKSEIKKYIYGSINKVKGDFRQEEILNKWRESFAFAPKTFQTFTIKIKVSSGTFIRALTENFNFPCCLLKLKRTKIFI